eukprot:58819_1
MATDPKMDVDAEKQRQKRVQAFNRRKNAKNSKNKHKNKKQTNRRKKAKENRKNDLRVNNGFNNDISDGEEEEIYNSLLKAVANHNKLSDPELQSVFQNALSKLNSAWFRQNLPLFFIQNDTNSLGDVILLVMRLFLFNFNLRATKHNVPFRYLLLALISPAWHQRGQTKGPLLQPAPQITNYHRSRALQILSLWVLETTQNIPKHQQIDNDDEDTEDTLTLESLDQYPDHTLLFLSAKEMDSLYSAFTLHELLSTRIRHKICDKIYHLVQHDHDALSAVSWTIYFGLIHEIPYDLLLIPLLRDQSLLHCALHYVDSIPSTHPEYREKVKRFIALSIAQLMDQNQTNISASRALKLLSVWKFDASQKEYEPINVCKITGFLKWTIYKGHIDDYARLVCSHSRKLQLFVIQQCHHHPSTYKSCVKWAKQWQLEQADACKSMVHHAKQWLLKNEYKEEQKQHPFINGFDDLSFCDIKQSQIVFVTSKEALQMAHKVLMDDAVDCIGLDMEMMAAELELPHVPQHCQVLQISTADIAFLFDLPCMKGDLLDAFDDLLTEIFSESTAVKVGIGFQGDLKHLRRQYPDAIAFKSVCTPYLELTVITKFMKADAEFKEKTTALKLDVMDENKEKQIKSRFSKTKDKEGGLAKIVRAVLNKRLNKFEQLSNWSNRPLRIEQLKYASLDSMVECWIFRKLKEWETLTVLPDLNGFYEMLYGQ